MCTSRHQHVLVRLGLELVEILMLIGRTNRTLSQSFICPTLEDENVILSFRCFFKTSSILVGSNFLNILIPFAVQSSCIFCFSAASSASRLKTWIIGTNGSKTIFSYQNALLIAGTPFLITAGELQVKWLVYVSLFLPFFEQNNVDLTLSPVLLGAMPPNTPTWHCSVRSLGDRWTAKPMVWSLVKIFGFTMFLSETNIKTMGFIHHFFGIVVPNSDFSMFDQSSSISGK